MISEKLKCKPSELVLKQNSARLGINLFDKVRVLTSWEFLGLGKSRHLELLWMVWMIVCDGIGYYWIIYNGKLGMIQR